MKTRKGDGMHKTTTIAHISDVHVTPPRGLTPKLLNVKRTLGLMNWHRGRKRVHKAAVVDLLVGDMQECNPDHFAVTGDLCNIGLPSEYTAALAWLKRIGPASDVTVVPGNHDIYTNTGKHPGVELWREFMSPDEFGSQLAGVAATQRGFPFVRRVRNVALVAVNSAVETPPFVAAGRIGKEQLAALETVLQNEALEGMARVVLIHHPPLPGLAPKARALADAEDFAAVLARTGAELVLHGHNHRDMLNWAHGPQGRIPVVGIASGSAAARHKDEPLGRYNIVRVTPAEKGWAIEVLGRGLLAVDGGVVEIEREMLACCDA